MYIRNNKHDSIVFVGQSKSKCLLTITFLSSRLDRSEVRTQQLNISIFNFKIIVKISAQVINKN
jgi:hypothetical protein